MSTTIYQPYTYLIGWSKLDRWYYGVEFSNNKSKTANPQNLWSKYFTSSKVVSQYRKDYGEPDIIEVRIIFKTKEIALRCEERILTKLNAMNSTRWLNRHNGGKNFNNCDEITREKISQNKKGKKNPKLSAALKGRRSPRKGIKTGPTGNPAWNTGLKCPQISKSNKGKKRIFSNPSLFSEKMRQHRLGKKHSEKTKQKISQNHYDVSGKNNPMYGKTRSPEWCKAQSEYMKNRSSPNKNKPSKLKGKTYEQIVGTERAKELKFLRSENMKRMRANKSNKNQ